MDGNWHKLQRSFYLQDDVLKIAKELIGKLLVTHFNDVICAAWIVETEAYNGIVDKASHAYGGKRTSRTSTMYMEGGCSYVYLCYGMHHLFNVVTNSKDIPHAVLIRAVQPEIGKDHMLIRTSKKISDKTLGSGPGNVSKALGIQTSHNGIDLCSDLIYIADDAYKIDAFSIKSTPRIGVDYAGDDAYLPYRFLMNDNPYVSAKKLTKKYLCV
ncbi:MAG: DNA-3-methyladenine glycosylase [Chitinophagaceae bacterium]